MAQGNSKDVLTPDFTSWGKGPGFWNFMRFTPWGYALPKWFDGTDADDTLRPLKLYSGTQSGDLTIQARFDDNQNDLDDWLLPNNNGTITQNSYRKYVLPPHTHNGVKYLHKAQVYSPITKKSVTVDTAGDTYEALIKAIPLDSTRALWVMMGGASTGQSDDIHLQVATIDGNGDLSMGTLQTVAQGVSGDPRNIDAALVDTDRVALVYHDSTSANHVQARIISISGSTITVNTNYTIHAENITSLGVCKVATGKAVVAMDMVADGTIDLVAFNYDGSFVITAGSAVASTDNTYSDPLCFEMEATADKGGVIVNTGGVAKMMVFTTSALVITLGAETTIHTSGDSGESTETISHGLHQYSRHNKTNVLEIATDKLLVLMHEADTSSGWMAGFIVTVSGTTPTAQTVTYKQYNQLFLAQGTYTKNHGQVLEKTAGSTYFFYCGGTDSSSSNYFGYGKACQVDVSGNAVTLGEERLQIEWQQVTGTANLAPHFYKVGNWVVGVYAPQQGATSTNTWNYLTRDTSVAWQATVYHKTTSLVTGVQEDIWLAMPELTDLSHPVNAQYSYPQIQLTTATATDIRLSFVIAELY